MSLFKFRYINEKYMYTYTHAPISSSFTYNCMNIQFIYLSFFNVCEILFFIRAVIQKKIPLLLNEYSLVSHFCQILVPLNILVCIQERAAVGSPSKECAARSLGKDSLT